MNITESGGLMSKLVGLYPSQRYSGLILKEQNCFARRVQWPPFYDHCWDQYSKLCCTKQLIALDLVLRCQIKSNQKKYKHTNKPKESFIGKNIWKTWSVLDYFLGAPLDSLSTCLDPALCPQQVEPKGSLKSIKGFPALWFRLVSANWRNRQETEVFILLLLLC